MSKGKFADTMMDLVRPDEKDTIPVQKEPMPEKVADKQVKREAKQSKAKANGAPQKTSTKTAKTTAEKKELKNPPGRPNTRGAKGEYKMMNIAIPLDIYEKLKAASNGNMTFFINSILRNSVE